MPKNIRMLRIRIRMDRQHWSKRLEIIYRQKARQHFSPVLKVVNLKMKTNRRRRVSGPARTIPGPPFNGGRKGSLPGGAAAAKVWRVSGPGAGAAGAGVAGKVLLARLH